MFSALDGSPALRRSLTETFRAVRAHRKMGVAEVARAMRMPIRSYHSLESGRSRPSLESLIRFANATSSDPFAIIIAIGLKSPTLAVRCADNKLALIMLYSLIDFDTAAGEDVAKLEPPTIIAAFRGVFDRLGGELKAHHAAETWLDAHAERLRLAKTPGDDDADAP